MFQNVKTKRHHGWILDKDTFECVDKFEIDGKELKQGHEFSFPYDNIYNESSETFLIAK